MEAYLENLGISKTLLVKLELPHNYRPSLHSCHFGGLKSNPNPCLWHQNPHKQMWLLVILIGCSRRCKSATCQTSNIYSIQRHSNKVTFKCITATNTNTRTPCNIKYLMILQHCRGCNPPPQLSYTNCRSTTITHFP